MLPAKQCSASEKRHMASSAKEGFRLLSHADTSRSNVASLFPINKNYKNDTTDIVPEHCLRISTRNLIQTSTLRFQRVLCSHAKHCSVAARPMRNFRQTRTGPSQSGDALAAQPTAR